jgi:hypothetical protein
MKGKLPVAHMAHLVGTFFGMSGLATEVQGKYIGFNGDQGNGGYPIPFILPPQNLGVWLKTEYLHDTASFETFHMDEDNRDKLWMMGANNKHLTKAPLPCLLALPTFVAEILGQQGGHAFHTNYANLYQNTSTEGSRRSGQQNGN